MASISKEPNGYRRIQFVAADGKRKSLRLGKVSQRFAEAVKFRVEVLAAILPGHALDPDTAKWVQEIEQKLANKLARLGLIPGRIDKPAATLGPFLVNYVESRTDVKGATKTVYSHTQRNLVGFLGAAKPLAAVSAGDAEDFRLYLGQQNLSDNTIRRRMGIAKQFFRKALRKRLIAENPFADVTGLTVRGNKERQFFIARETTERVLAACPDAQWRLLFALSRFGGLRCPSEHLGLRWADIDWEHDRMTVASPKTERHAGKESRVVPIFPELRPYLDAVFAEAKDGDEFVITRYRNPAVNLRSQLQKIIRRAGVVQWPKLWHNLRASRQTELAETYPAHVVCAWIGNSLDVAQEHYLQVTEAHFAKAVQNPAQQMHATSGNKPQMQTTPETEADHKPLPLITSQNISDFCVSSEQMNSGRYWTRTSDPYRVRIVL